MTKQMERDQSPVDPADAEVFGKMIFELIFALLRRQCQLRGNMHDSIVNRTVSKL
jgi:hypothetical protein